MEKNELDFYFKKPNVAHYRQVRVTQVQLPSFDAYSTPVFLWAMNGIF